MDFPPGKYTITFTVKPDDPAGPAVTTTHTIGHGPPPVLVVGTPPAARVGVPYTHTFTASAGTPPYTFTRAAGTLPAGLTLSTAGVLSGTPTAAGAFSFTVRVTDSATRTAQAAVPLTVAPAVPAPPPLTLSVGTPPAATVGAAYTHTLTAAGGTAPRAFSLVAGTLPAGLTLSAAGAVSGTPTAAGSFSATVRVTDASVPPLTAQAPLPVVVAPAAGTPDPLARPTLRQTNFQFLGSFRPPAFLPSGLSTGFSKSGFTHRRVNGQLRFILASQTHGGGQAYEVAYPGLGTGADLPEASLTREWGDIYGGKKWVENEGGTGALGNGVWTYGLYFDETRRRLYWSYGHWYNQPFPYNPCFGYSEISDLTGAATAHGPWRVTDRPEKQTRGGCLRIPQWFADRYTAGKSLGAGFGGYFSIIGTGGSMGPALAAVSDPDPTRDAPRAGLPGVPLVGYTFGGPVRCERNPDYISYYDDLTGGGPFQASGGIGRWTWSDMLYGAAAWIDMPAVHGLLFLSKMGQGRVRYENATTKADRGVYEWFVYDPRDLADVAQGRKAEDQIQPVARWADPALPLSPLDVAGWEGDGEGQVTGATFDPVDNRLYVLTGATWHSHSEWHPQISVFQLR